MNELPDTPEDPAPAAGLRATGRLPRRGLLGLMLLVFVVALVGAATVWAVFKTEAGTRAALARLPQLTSSVKVLRPSGRLLGDFAAERVEVWRAGHPWLLIDQLAWQGARVVPAPDAAWRLGLSWDVVRARRITLLNAADSKATPVAVPQSLALPLAVRIGQIQVGSVSLPGLGGRDLLDVAARGLALQQLQDRHPLPGVTQLPGRGPLRVHMVEQLSLRWDRLHARASARIAVQAPFLLTLDLQAQSPLAADSKAAGAEPAPKGVTTAPAPKVAAALPDLSLALTASGSLEQLDLRAQLAARSAAMATPARTGVQDMQIEGRIHPFAPMPVSRLSATAQRLDVSDWITDAPRTDWTGRVQVRPSLASESVQSPAPADGLPAAGGASRPVGAAPPDWTIEAALSNEAAGAWTEARVPVRRLDLLGHVQGWQAASGRLDALAVQLGTARQPAGSVQAQATWRAACAGACKPGLAAGLQTPRWQVQAHLQDVQPALLHAAAPAMRLSGKVSAQALTEELGPWPLTVQTQLAGVLDAWHPEHSTVQQAVPVFLDAQAHIDSDKVQIDRLLAQAGPASARSQASLQGQLQRRDGNWWAVGQVGLEGFDPGLWWPGWAGSGGQAAGQTQLYATGQLDLSWAATPAGAASGRPDRLRSLGGHADVQLDRSRLLGLPISARLQLSGDARQPLVGLNATADAAGNHLSLQGQAHRSDPGADHWAVQMDAPALNRLAPLAQLLGWAGLQGRLQAQADVQGRWPVWRTSGQIDGRDLRALPDFAAQPLALDHIQGRWNLDTRMLLAAGSTSISAAAGDAPLSADVEAQGLTLGNFYLGRLHATSTGTARAHRLQMGALAELRRSAAMPAAPAASAHEPLRLQLDLAGSGGWAAVGAADGGGWRWAGHLDQLDLRSDSLYKLQQRVGRQLAAPPGLPAAGASAARDALAAAPALSASSPQAALLRAQAMVSAPLLRAADVNVQVSRRPGSWEWNLAPTHIDSLGASLVLHRVRGRIQASSTPDGRSSAAPAAELATDLDIQADLEPVAVAPLLALWQPGSGWGGDLLVGGKLRLRHVPGSSEGLALDAELARRSGDLTVSDSEVEGGAVLRLNLTEARLAAQASRGQWHFSQRAQGRNLGSLTGDLNVRTSPHALWPVAGSELDGQVDVQIANLRAWGSWVPPGWRLGGELQAQARLGGRWAEPQYTGSLRGQNLSLRNLLEGVDLRDGDLAVALQGPTAKVEHFSIKSGEGEISASGDAAFGDVPRAELRLQARRFAAMQRVDRRLVFSGGASIKLDADALALDGQVALDEGLVDISRSDAPSLGDDVVVLRANGPDAQDQDLPAPNSARQARIHLRIGLANQLRLRGRGLDTVLGGDLTLTNPNQRLALNGTINTVSGTYAAYGQKLGIDHGSISFSGPIANPRLDIQASRERTVSSASFSAVSSADDVRVGVIITGTALAPRVRLFSEPELSDSEKLSWLVLGRGSSGLGRTDVALLQSAAAALLAGDGDGPGDWVQAIGLDELSVRQSDGDVRDTVVAIGKQLSRRWYVGYERGLNATAGTWQLVYRAAQRFSVRAQSGLDNSLDLIWSWRWK